jgi:hypothetical protein
MRRGAGIAAAICATLLLAPAARAAGKEAIQRAVDRGLASLRGVQGPDGTWPGDQIGATALGGLTFLESGVKADDPAVARAAKTVREQSVTLDKTYSLSLAIMFLDRLADPADDELIDSMAVRLLGGQDPQSGGWSYNCPPLGEAEVRRLQAALRQRNELVARAAPPEAPKDRPSVQDLPPEIQQQLRLINQQQPVGQEAGGGRPADNSNTQFAVLALWIARRKGIPVETALRRIDTRFRLTQHPDGGWAYTPPPGVPLGAVVEGPFQTMGAMTCAGLLGLALSHGSALEATLHTGPAGGAPPRGAAPRDIGKDPAVLRGLRALGSFIGKPLPQLAISNPMGNPAPPADGQGNGRAYYFLFSLERVAVVYGLDKIGDKDWYNWGADALLACQNRDGSWTGEFGAADTCFALLFLRRANLAKDLTATLQGRVKDPGAELHAVDPATLGKAGGPKPPAAEVDRGGTPTATRPAAPAVSPEAAQLSDELVKAGAARQAEVLRRLRDSKGPVYTDALAHAIHRLDGVLKGQARDALADRLTRMKKDTLDDKLRDDDLEVRRAAALAAAMKDEKAHVPRLIELLQDPEGDVARAAHAALKSLTNQDFGPARDASRADVARAATAWKDWWGRTGDR